MLDTQLEELNNNCDDTSMYLEYPYHVIGACGVEHGE